MICSQNRVQFITQSYHVAWEDLHGHLCSFWSLKASVPIYCHSMHGIGWPASSDNSPFMFNERKIIICLEQDELGKWQFNFMVNYSFYGKPFTGHTHRQLMLHCTLQYPIHLPPNNGSDVMSCSKCIADLIKKCKCGFLHLDKSIYINVDEHNEWM